MSQSVDELLKDAEESAVRALRERDQAIREAEGYKRLAAQASAQRYAQDLEVPRLRETIRQLQETIRLGSLQIENLRLEVKLLKQQAKLLKAKNAPTER